MILSSICHVNVDQCCHLQFTMACADTEIGLGLDSENNNIWICITSGAAEIKKSRKRIFIFFLICPNLELAGLRNYLSKNSGLKFNYANKSKKLITCFSTTLNKILCY